VVVEKGLMNHMIFKISLISISNICRGGGYNGNLDNGGYDCGKMLRVFEKWVTVSKIRILVCGRLRCMENL
jgi:hypothetical protein